MTPTERACLNAFKSLTVNGVAPSYDEVRVRLGGISKSNVHRMVNSLERQGYIYRTGPGARSVQVMTDKAAYTFGALAQLSDDELKNLAADIGTVLLERAPRQ